MLTNGRGGVERDVTWSWVSNGKLEVVAHFSSPVPVDERFVLIFEIFWPCKCERFVKRLQRDEFAFFVSNHLPKFEYTIELPKGKDALFDAIGFDPDRNPRASLARQHGETDGIVRIMLSYIDVVEKSRIGMSLQLKRPALAGGPWTSGAAAFISTAHRFDVSSSGQIQQGDSNKHLTATDC